MAGQATGDPGREDRAPLRLDLPPRSYGHGAGVTPVAKTGLHCGELEAAGGDLGDGVTPVAKTGLHCGLGAATGEQAVREGDPGREDRAPLRHFGRQITGQGNAT